MKREDVEKKYGKEFADMIFAGGEPTEEEIKESQDSWKALRGTAFESAIMQENGDIYFVNRCNFPDGGSAHGEDTITKENPEYSNVCKRFGLNEPGDQGRINKKWSNDTWVDINQQAD